MRPALSIVIPARDEAARLPATLQRLETFLAAGGLSCEVLVVDDGSRDATAEALRASALPGLRLLQHERGRGKGAACRTGMLAARGEHVLITDADLSVPIATVVPFLQIAADADVVIGSKFVPGAAARYPLGRRLGSWCGGLLIRALVVRGFHDTQCGFKLFRREAGQILFRHTRLDGFGCDFELLFLARRLGMKVVERPVEVAHHSGGSVNLRGYLRTLGEIARIVALRLRGAYPRRP